MKKVFFLTLFFLFLSILIFPKNYTWSEIKKEILKNNHNLKSYSYQIFSSLEKEKATQAELKPLQKFSLGYNHYFKKQFLAPISKFPPDARTMNEDIYNADYILSIPLIKNGRVKYKVRAQKEQTISLKWDKKRLKQSLLFNSQKLFYAILGAKKLLEAVKFSKKVVARQKEDLEAMFKEGKVTKVDLLKIQVREAALEENIIKIQNQIKILKENLLKIMGIEMKVDDFKIIGGLKHQKEVLDFESSWKLALKNRSDLKSLNSKIKAQKNKIKALLSQLKGEVNLKGFYSYRYNKDGDDDDFSFIGISYDILISEGGRIRKRVVAEEKLLKSLLEKKKSLLLKIRQEVNQSLYEIESSKKRIEAFKEAVKESKEAMRIEKEKYNAGKSPIREFLDSQDDYLQTEAKLTSAEVDYATSVAGWKFAIETE